MQAQGTSASGTRESVREQGKLTPEVEAQIRGAETKARLEDIYLPFKPKRRTKAQIAREAGLEPLAEGLGMTGRHLRRLFVQHLGVAPLAVEQARRINLAKQLLHETRLSMTEVAFASGFGSLRRFNQAFLSLFGRPPTALRRESGAAPSGPGEAIRLRLAYRPPFDWRERLGAWRNEGTVEGARMRLPLAEGGEALIDQGAGRTLEVVLHGVPVRDLARVIARLKRELFHARPAELPQAA